MVDLAGEEAFETPDDLASGPTVRGPSRDVVEGRLVVPHADDDGAIEGRIGLSVPAPIEAVPAGGDPRRSGDGTRAQSFAKAASERIRSGLSPKRINIAAAVLGPTPKPARRVGDVVVVSRARCCSCVAISSARAAQRGIEVSYETIRQWCLTFGPAYAGTLRSRRGRLGDTSYLDEGAPRS